MHAFLDSNVTIPSQIIRSIIFCFVRDFLASTQREGRHHRDLTGGRNGTQTSEEKVFAEPLTGLWVWV